MPQLQVAPGTDELHQLFGTGIAFNALGSELHVDQTGSAGAHTVVLRVVVGEQDGGGTIVVGAVRRGRTVSQREPRHAAVRGSGNNLTEGHVRGEGHVTGVVVDAHFLAVLGGEGHGHAVEFAADFVGVFVVVAVAGSRAEKLLDVFVAFEVGFESVDELIHGELLVFKHKLLDGGQGVDDGAEAHEFKVAEVQAFGDLGLMQVDAVLAAESVQHGAHGLGEVLGAGLDNNVLLDERGTEQEHVLLHVGVPEFVPALELAVDFVRMEYTRHRFWEKDDTPVVPLKSQTLEDVIGTWPQGKINVRIGDYMFRPHQKWTITAVPDGGGYLGGPYYKIVIEGTNRALAATADAEVVTVPEFTGAPEQLWRIDQLTDGTYRIMPKEVPGTDKELVLVSVGDSTPSLGEFDMNSDNSKWNFRDH